MDRPWYACYTIGDHGTKRVARQLSVSRFRDQNGVSRKVIATISVWGQKAGDPPFWIDVDRENALDLCRRLGAVLGFVCLTDKELSDAQASAQARAKPDDREVPRPTD